jgi:hypothetical protein
VLEPSFQKAALKSIIANYPKLDSSKLVYSDWILGEVIPNLDPSEAASRAAREEDPAPEGVSGEKYMIMRYLFPPSATTNEFYTPEGKWVKTTTTMYCVWMSPSRKVREVHQSTSTYILKAVHKSEPMPNTALEPTATAPSVSTNK